MLGLKSLEMPSITFVSDILEAAVTGHEKVHRQGLLITSVDDLSRPN
jgi:hypothetical protein